MEEGEKKNLSLKQFKQLTFSNTIHVMGYSQTYKELKEVLHKEEEYNKSLVKIYNLTIIYKFQTDSCLVKLVKRVTKHTWKARMAQFSWQCMNEGMKE